MRNPIMVGPRVYLRPLEAQDALSMAEAQARETDTFMHRGRPVMSPMQWEGYIERMHEPELTTGMIELAICLKEDDFFIGSLGFEWVDWINQVAESVSWFHEPEYRNKGYGTEAKQLMLEYLFDRLQLTLVVSCVFGPNWRSMSALKKQGYVFAGEEKYVDIKDGQFHGYHWHYLTRDAWLAAREEWKKEQRAYGIEID